MLIKVLIFVFLFLILFQFFEQSPMLVENFAKNAKKQIKKATNSSFGDIKPQKIVDSIEDKTKDMVDKVQRDLTKLQRDIENNFVSKDEFEQFKEETQNQTEEIL